MAFAISADDAEALAAELTTKAGCAMDMSWLEGRLLSRNENEETVLHLLAKVRYRLGISHLVYNSRCQACLRSVFMLTPSVIDATSAHTWWRLQCSRLSVAGRHQDDRVEALRAVFALLDSWQVRRFTIRS